mmetsp:Transcript_29044/g.44321  ORF Transcript_29044/g.44321 Transcript_29044/m.44321 type:complete len:150 (-) Transcript_29044:180-629(-)|eukprot:CAMPEP_0194114220 /NCGR_PEP_ID=MMETSP0150-20130528/19339_1 /TAXON_ID=122233 /ORGANISM="Chaetoceros debilis, Strain MM31A-1" /LENGTH=149 /DNA_ID=CAMNT_0038804353 /DNA_START=106 /DNA_END=555 /DNA_ORIENTATION=-
MSGPLREMLKVTATGAATVLATTVTSCTLAIAIEATAHRMQYKMFPHWYNDVKYATGLPHLAERQIIINKNTNTGEKTEVKDEFTTAEVILYKEEDVTTSLSELEKKLASDDSQTHFQSYQEKLQEKSEMLNLSPERVSKILLTTAMTG